MAAQFGLPLAPVRVAHPNPRVVALDYLAGAAVYRRVLPGLPASLWGAALGWHAGYLDRARAAFRRARPLPG